MYSLLSLALGGVCGQRHVMDALRLGKIPDVHFIVGWVGPAAIWRGKNISVSPGFQTLKSPALKV